MTPRFIRRLVAAIALTPIGLFAIIAILSFFGITPSDWLFNALASIAAISISACVLYLAFVAGYEIFEATEPKHFSPIRLAIGLAIAFALVSFFELFL